MNSRVIPFKRHAAEPDASPRRFWPVRGQLLTLANIRGPWRPSGAVGGAGVFAVVWETWAGSFWAPLHDFAAPDLLRLVEACRGLDQGANSPAASSQVGP